MHADIRCGVKPENMSEGRFSRYDLNFEEAKTDCGYHSNAGCVHCRAAFRTLGNGYNDSRQPLRNSRNILPSRALPSELFTKTSLRMDEQTRLYVLYPAVLDYAD